MMTSDNGYFEAIVKYSIHLQVLPVVPRSVNYCGKVNCNLKIMYYYKNDYRMIMKFYRISRNSISFFV